MRDKSRNTTWGRVLTPRPIIILFETTADSSDRVTWQACSATQTQLLNTHTGKMTHLHRQPSSPTTAPIRKWCTRPLARSVSVTETPSPRRSDVKLNERDSRSQRQTSLLAAHLEKKRKIFSHCPFIQCVSLLLCSSLSVPSFILLPKNESQPPEGLFHEKKRKNIYISQSGYPRNDTLKGELCFLQPCIWKVDLTTHLHIRHIQ